MNRRGELLRLLADGAEHSGEALASQLDVTRAAVWKQLQSLDDIGLSVEAAPRRGYRLAEPLDLLEAPAIRQALPGMARERLRNLELNDVVDSTNDQLLAVRDLPAGRFDACFAEYQQAGRGRRGRHWTSPFGSGLCLSLNWAWAETPPQLGALSLVVGAAIVQSLQSLSAGGLQLKWPNDILHQGKKLGGILIELRAESGGPAYVVVGVGLNTRLSQQSREALRAAGTEATDLTSALAQPPARSELAGKLLGSLALALDEFGRSGLRPWLEHWRRADALRGQSVIVSLGEQRIEGISAGIDEEGALCLDCNGARRRFVSGEVSLRAAGSGS